MAASQRRRPIGKNAIGREWKPSVRQMNIYDDATSGQYRYAELARKYKVSKPAITYTVKKVTDWLMPQLVEDSRRYKVRHTSSLERIFVACMKEFEASRTARSEQLEEVSEGKTHVKESRSVGDAALIAQARAALADIRKIWGIEGPVGDEWKTNDLPQALSHAEARAELAHALLNYPQSEN